MRFLILVFLLLSPLIGVHSGSQEQQTPEAWYEVWEAYRKAKYSGAPVLVVSSEVAAPLNRRGMPGVDTLSPALRQAVEDLGDESGKWAVLDNPLALGANVRLLSQDEFIGRSGGTLNDRWEAFRLEFPESPGLIQLHPVGFSNDSATAVFDAGRGQGPWACRLGGVVMVLEEGIWRIEKENFGIVVVC